MSQSIEEIKSKKAFICDMDGVIYHGNRLLPDVHEFVDWLYKNDKQFLFLTNSSERSPRELSQKLKRMGLDVSEDHFYTSALATASFLSSQKPGTITIPITLFSAKQGRSITKKSNTPFSSCLTAQS